VAVLPKAGTQERQPRLVWLVMAPAGSSEPSP
jgi:hypothetical protein